MKEYWDPRWINENKVRLFDVRDYVEKIKLEPNTLYEAENTAQQFEDYLKELSKYPTTDLIYKWLDSGLTEQKFSSQIENHIFTNSALSSTDLFFERTTINHERIKRIHKFVCEKSETHTVLVGEYRKSTADVRVYLPDGTHQIYWHAANPEDVKPFMDSFINFYKSNGVSELYNNPFIKSALAHLLFVRIHPFGDGNGRSARIIQNIAFTSGINRVYGTKLKLSPLNISSSIFRTKMEYSDIINRVIFDLDYNNNEVLNEWLRYILYKYQEQMFFCTNRFDILESDFEEISEQNGLQLTDVQESIDENISNDWNVKKLF